MQGESVRVIRQGFRFHPVFRKPCDGFRNGGEQGVHSQENVGLLIERYELGSGACPWESNVSAKCWRNGILLGETRTASRNAAVGSNDSLSGMNNPALA